MTIRVTTRTTVEAVMEGEPEDFVAFAKEAMKTSPELAAHFIRAGMEVLREIDPDTQGQIMSNVFQAIARTDPKAYADMCATMMRAGAAAMVTTGPQLWFDMIRQGGRSPLMMTGAPQKKDGP